MNSENITVRPVGREDAADLRENCFSMNTLEEVEEQIQLARRYYNGAVRNLNILVESFPSKLVADAFHFSKAEYFEIDDHADRQVPKVDFSQAPGDQG